MVHSFPGAHRGHSWHPLSELLLTAVDSLRARNAAPSDGAALWDGERLKRVEFSDLC